LEKSLIKNKEKMESQLTSEQINELTKQGYRIAGDHSAVKICEWTRKMIRGEEGCYKYKFYGIRSHRCMQMTTSMCCANRCIFCWRGEKAPLSKDWIGCVDDPSLILEEALKRQKDLLYGFKGSEKVDPKIYQECEDVKHVALSLTGESIIYPKVNELIDEFHKRKITTFVVTNGQFPEKIKELNPVTQLSISLDAADKESLKEIDRPLFKDYWERLLASLDELAKKKHRTCVRLSIIKGFNDREGDTEKYAELIKCGNPDFIKIKGYVHVGASRKFLKRENMPSHEEIKKLSEKLITFLPNYEIISDHEPSKVFCLIKKSMKKKQYIDFAKFFGGEFNAEEYSSNQMCPNV